MTTFYLLIHRFLCRFLRNRASPDFIEDSRCRQSRAFSTKSEQSRNKVGAQFLGSAGAEKKSGQFWYWRVSVFINSPLFYHSRQRRAGALVRLWRKLEKGEDGAGGWVLQLTVAPLGGTVPVGACFLVNNLVLFNNSRACPSVAGRRRELFYHPASGFLQSK